MKRRLEDYLDRHPGVSAVVTFVIIGAIAAMDGNRLLNRLEADGRTVVGPSVLGLFCTVLTLCWLRWYFRRSRASRIATVALVVWVATCFVAFAFAHPRPIGDSPSTPLQVFLVSYFFGLELAGTGIVPVRLWRLRSEEVGREHRRADLVEVWQVRDGSSHAERVPPYFIARCECGWVGTAYDEADHEAESSAFAEARSHGSRVAPEVASPLD